MKFGTLIAKGILKRFRGGDILNFQHGAHSSHFSKWLPATTVFLWVMDVIWYFWLICHTNLHRDVFWTIEHCHWIFKMAAIFQDGRRCLYDWYGCQISRPIFFMKQNSNLEHCNWPEASFYSQLCVCMTTGIARNTRI